MEQSPAERLAARRTMTRPMPAIVAPPEGRPALQVRKGRSVERPRNLNTPITDRTFELIDNITRHYKNEHGRTWRMNMTIELAVEDLARKLGLVHGDR